MINKYILIACVNYNSTGKLLEYLDSLESAQNMANNISLTVLVGDNSEEFVAINFNKYTIEIIHTNNKANLGYFGGIKRALELSNINMYSYDYFIISNVDVTVKEDFLELLEKYETKDDIGWIAPSILSEKELKDRNPKTIEKPSKLQIRIGILFYTFSFLLYLYEIFFYSSKNRSIKKSNRYIFSGHGSFIILTKEFLKKRIELDYPILLFGEELYLGLLLENNELRVYYEPSLIVYDYDHFSTGKIKNRRKNKLQCKALKYILNNYK